jgi:hypothetical protein
MTPKAYTGPRYNGDMRAWILLASLPMLGGQTLPLADILSRVSEEAEVFRRVAPRALAEETLAQRSLKPPPRFRIAGAKAPAKPEYRTREIVSEYSFSGVKESEAVIHEFRQVISVDGRPITTPEKARHALSLGLQSDDDRTRKRMLEEFRKYGLIDAAMDFGQVILLFSRRRLHNYDFRIVGTDRLGADEATVLSYDQRQGDQGFLVFEGRKTIRSKLDGKLWVRRTDGLPLRISLRAQWTEQRNTRRHEAVVEYALTSFGTVGPASVKHSEYFDDLLITENLFRYTPFKKFGADAAIKFDAEPEPLKK